MPPQPGGDKAVGKEEEQGGDEHDALRGIGNFDKAVLYVVGLGRVGVWKDEQYIAVPLLDEGVFIDRQGAVEGIERYLVALDVADDYKAVGRMGKERWR